MAKLSRGDLSAAVNVWAIDDLAWKFQHFYDIIKIWITIFRSWQHNCIFADDIFKLTFLSKDICISIAEVISLHDQ